MTIDLDEIWRNARLWPTNAKSYLTHLNETGEAISSEDIQNTANLNMTASSARDSLADLGSRRSDAFSALGRGPSTEKAERAYRLLIAHREIDSGVLRHLNDDESQRDIAGSFFLFVILNAPHKVAIKNAIGLFDAVGQFIDADVLRTFCIDPFLVPYLYPLCHKANLGEADKNRLVRTMAQDECFDAQCHLYERLTDDSPDDLRRYLLRHALFAVSPPFEVYDGFDVSYNPEFHPEILEFANRTRLASELDMDTVDDQLITAALSFFDDLSSCWSEDVPWESFEAVIPATAMLCALLDHLQEKPLPLQEIALLADIFDVLFSEPLSWIEEEPGKTIDPAFLISKQATHISIGQKVLQILTSPPIRQELDRALSSMGNPDYYEAMRVLVHISSDDPFDVVYPYLQKELPRNTNVCVSYGALLIFFHAAKSSSEKAQKAADWCVDYCRFERSGGYIPAPGYEFILTNILRIVKRFPGIGSSLVCVGLGSQSPARRLAMEVLNAWPVEFWPPRLLWRLDSALKHDQQSLELLRSVRQTLLDYSEEKDEK